jgi:hypothetical protein
MPMLECPGIFTMPLVPEGWTATSEANHTLFELQPPEGDAAVHISVYRRTEHEAPMPGEAEALLMRFVSQRPTEGSPRIIVLAPEREEHRVFAKSTRRNKYCNYALRPGPGVTV